MNRRFLRFFDDIAKTTGDAEKSVVCRAYCGCFFFEVLFDRVFCRHGWNDVMKSGRTHWPRSR